MSIPREFELDKIKYRVIGPQRKLASPFRCLCGCEDYDFIFDMYDGLYYNEELAKRFNSMEVSIYKCKSCGKLYLRREWNDYDAFLFHLVEVI